MGFVDKIISSMKITDEEDDDYVYVEPEQDVRRPARVRQDMAAEEKRSNFRPVVKKDVPKTTRNMNGMEVCMIKPTSIDDAREITDTLLSNRTVVLNLEGIDDALAQSLLYFTSGSTYAMKGNLQKISHRIFIVTPPSVDVSGDFAENMTETFSMFKSF